jgi:hypothetical protein
MKAIQHYLMGQAGVALTLLAACAHLPDASIRYYLPKTQISFKVVRTIACDGNDQLVISNVATQAVVNVPDRKTAYSLPLAKLRGSFSDTDVKLEFYDGGRLKSFNASSTGQGEAILKTVVSLVTPILGLEAGTKSYPAECKAIKKAGGDKPLTLTYVSEVDLSTVPSKVQQIPAEATSQANANRFAPVVGGVCAIVESKSAADVPAVYKARSDEMVLNAREPAWVKIKVKAGGDNDCQSPSAAVAWEGELPVAQLGTDYVLPIPTPVLFGKELTAVSFAESGALTSVQFTSNTGVGQALNVVNAGEQALKPESIQQKAADLKAEADVIAQQQRVVGCLAEPKNCK